MPGGRFCNSDCKMADHVESTPLFRSKTYFTVFLPSSSMHVFFPTILTSGVFGRSQAGCLISVFIRWNGSSDASFGQGAASASCQNQREPTALTQNGVRGGWRSLHPVAFERLVVGHLVHEAEEVLSAGVAGALNGGLWASGRRRRCD